MGRTYLYDCRKCGYQARVAGGATEGNELIVQTIQCRDCNHLHDAVIAVKSPLSAPDLDAPPPVEALMRRLPLKDPELRWDYFQIACPVSPEHLTKEWKDPGKCPHCGVFMERSAMPFRQWD